MGWYEGIKDAVSLAQKADNIELYRALLNIQKEALELQEENRKLKEKIKQFEDNSEIENKLKRYEGKTYCTFIDDKGNKRYICSRCWEKNKVAISLLLEYAGDYTCPECDNKGVYDDEKWNTVHDYTKMKPVIY
jgi:DNA-directed RNA polymerase subunit RPC12/RpoP